MGSGSRVLLRRITTQEYAEEEQRRYIANLERLAGFSSRRLRRYHRNPEIFDEPLDEKPSRYGRRPSFEEAKILVKPKNFSSGDAYRKAISWRKQHNLPSNAQLVYADVWEGWVDFLGKKTEAQKRQLVIETYQKTGLVKSACEAAKVGRATAKKWLAEANLLVDDEEKLKRQRKLVISAFKKSPTIGASVGAAKVSWQQARKWLEEEGLIKKKEKLTEAQKRQRAIASFRKTASLGMAREAAQAGREKVRDWLQAEGFSVDELTEEQKRQLVIETYRKTGKISQSCTTGRVGREKGRKWLEEEGLVGKKLTKKEKHHLVMETYADTSNITAAASAAGVDWERARDWLREAGIIETKAKLTRKQERQRRQVIEIFQQGGSISAAERAAEVTWKVAKKWLQEAGLVEQEEIFIPSEDLTPQQQVIETYQNTQSISAAMKAVKVAWRTAHKWIQEAELLDASHCSSCKKYYGSSRNPLPMNYRPPDLSDYEEPLDLIDDGLIHLNDAIQYSKDKLPLYASTNFMRAANMFTRAAEWMPKRWGKVLFIPINELWNMAETADSRSLQDLAPQILRILPALDEIVVSESYLGQLNTADKLARIYETLNAER
jgi:transposase-like protein